MASSLTIHTSSIEDIKALLIARSARALRLRRRAATVTLCVGLRPTWSSLRCGPRFAVVLASLWSSLRCGPRFASDHPCACTQLLLKLLKRRAASRGLRKAFTAFGHERQRVTCTTCACAQVAKRLCICTLNFLMSINLMLLTAVYTGGGFKLIYCIAMRSSYAGWASV